MDRLHSKCSADNVGIGTDFAPFHPKVADTQRKCKAWDSKHGVQRLNRANRTCRLWQKYKAGLLHPSAAANVLRDHAEEFARFEAEARN
jgi:hypothetical protein